MATPIGMNNASTFDSMSVRNGLGLHAYDRSKIYMESLKYDILTGNQNLIEVVETETNGNTKITGDKFITKVTPNGDVGTAATDVTLEYVKAIAEDAIEGNGTAYIGNESIKDVLYTKAYANDYARPIASFGFGIDKLEQDWWKLSDVDRKLLSQWLGETNGYYSRQALCEGVSSNLTKAPINLTSALMNPNSYIVGAGGSVAYGINEAAYKANIQTAFDTGTASHLTVPVIVELGDVAQLDAYIKPVTIDGKNLYGLLTSREEVRQLRSADNTSSYAEYYLQGSALARVQDIVPEADMVIGDVIIIPDDRAPDVDSTDGASFSFGYVKQGRTSTRTTATAAGHSYLNVNILLGANALLQYDRSMPDFKTQLDDYGRDVGTLIHACSGFVLPIWTDDTASETPRYEGGMLVFTKKESFIGDKA